MFGMACLSPIAANKDVSETRVSADLLIDEHMKVQDGMIQGLKEPKCIDNSILNVGFESQVSLCYEEIKKFEWRLRVEAVSKR